MKVSSRKLTIAEYFRQIQREYLITDFRRKIYSSAKDKGYYTRVAKYKKNRINDIATRNFMKSIFNDPTTLQTFQGELFDSVGRPKFELTADDAKNYYLQGSDFVYQGNIYKVVDREEDNLVLTDGTKEITVLVQETHRVL